MGNPASATNRDDRPSYEQAWARILEGSRCASSIMVLSREAWMEGMRPRTFGNFNVTFLASPGLESNSSIGSVNWKG